VSGERRPSGARQTFGNADIVGKRMKLEPDYVTSLGRPFTAHRLRRLAELLVDGYASWLPRFGVTAPARSLSTLILLARQGAQGVTELADKLQLSHPLLIKLVAGLEELGLVTARQDPRDGRRRPILLTPRGEAEAQRVVEAVAVMDAAYEDLFDEVQADLIAVVSAIEAACIREDFSARLARKGREWQLNKDRTCAQS
jgi:DNA-binding MarR family transcriptional regulator